MTIQVVGYTMQVVNSENGVDFNADVPNVASPVDADYEQALWDSLDALAAYFTESRDPEYSPFVPRLIRREKEDVVLTHP